MGDTQSGSCWVEIDSINTRIENEQLIITYTEKVEVGGSPNRGLGGTTVYTRNVKCYFQI